MLTGLSGLGGEQLVGPEVVGEIVRESVLGVAMLAAAAARCFRGGVRNGLGL